MNKLVYLQNREGKENDVDQHSMLHLKLHHDWLDGVDYNMIRHLFTALSVVNDNTAVSVYLGVGT